MKTENIGLFGGTFSPPHNGHVYAVRKLAENFKLDRILIMPSSIPPHKVKLSCDTAQQRLEMCRAAFSGIEGVEVSSFEVDNGGVSYTVETLEYFTKPGRRIYLLCGTDMFLTLDKWYRAKTIFSLADIVCVPRYYTDKDSLDATKIKYESEYGASVHIIDTNPLEISSTEIREKIEGGIVDRTVIPESVAGIIEREGLYGKV